MKRSFPSDPGAFTLLELLIVIAIIAILSVLAVPAYNGIKERAVRITHISNVRDMTTHTLRWAADHGDTLPSPEVSAEMVANEGWPDHWKGLWLDGVIFQAAMDEAGDGLVTEVDADGKHLKGTIFFSTQSFKKDSASTNMYHHSYAMNKSLQYNYIHESSSDRDLTNKSLARITHRPSALLFIENRDSNIIGVDDREAIIETGENRWSSKHVIASFLDGSTRTLTKNDIPKGADVDTDRVASRFWKGVDPD